MKGQMFILTMVFLAGLVFAIQTSLTQFALVDLADPLKGNEALLFQTVKESFQHVAAESLTCEDAGNSLAELEAFMNKRVVRGASLSVDYTLDCAKWRSPDPAVTLTIALKSVSLDASETISF